MTIVAWSMGMAYALKAAEELAKEGISAEIIDLRTIRPMDTETVVHSIEKTDRWSSSRRAGRRRASAPRSRRG